MTDEEMAEEYAGNTSGLDISTTLMVAENKTDAYRLGRYDGFFAGLKAGRPQWHDLRKDKNDLPDEGTYLVVWQNARGYRATMIMKYEEDDEEKLHWFDEEQDCWDDDVIAWCEIPTFNKE